MISSAPECVLPPLPQPVTFVGFPDGERIFVTKTDLADLGRYLLGMRQWIEAASSCLEVR
jgi:hypothetical protein